MIYGLFAYFTPDYLLALLFIILLYACMYHKTILICFVSLCCFQTKETGLIVVGGLALGMILHDIIENHRNHPIKRVFTDIRLYGILAVTIVQGIYYVTAGGIAQWTQNAGETAGLRWDNNGVNCLGFQPDYIITKLKQQLILNFNWVFVVVIIAALVYYVIQRIQRKNTKDKLSNSVAHGTSITESQHAVQDVNYYIYDLIVCFFANVLFSCLYVTSALARYQIVCDVMLYLIGLSAVYYLLHNNYRKIYIWSQIGFLLLIGIQCFITIDPISRLTFINMDYGNQTTIYVGSKEEALHYGDYLVYNTQGLGLNRILDKFLKEAAYSPEEYDIITTGSNGGCIIGNSGIYTYNWDLEKNSRVLYSSDNTIPFGNCFEYSEIEEQDCKNQALLLSLPYVKYQDMEHILDQVSEYYEIGEEKTVSTIQGSITYYVLTLK